MSLVKSVFLFLIEIHSLLLWMDVKYVFQDKMADHMKTYLGSMLYTDPIEDHRTALPSPEELKLKILVKNNKQRKTL